MEKVFVPLFNFFQQKRAVFYTCLVLSFLFTGFFASKITLEEDIASVIPKDSSTQKLNTVLQNSKFADRLVVYLRLSDSSKAEPDSLVAYADVYIEKIKIENPRCYPEPVVIPARIKSSVLCN